MLIIKGEIQKVFRIFFLKFITISFDIQESEFIAIFLFTNFTQTHISQEP